MAALSRAAMLCVVAALLSPAAMSAKLPVGLSYDFHAESCPDLDLMVRNAVAAAIESDVGVVAGLLRVFFHDCFPQGCDASLLLTGEGSELDMPPNGGLRQNVLDLIESIRATVHAACGRTVSCADITNLATRQAVMQSGVPGYQVPLGRYDSVIPATEDQVKLLPGPDDTIQELVKTFWEHGQYDIAQVVALSGAHTIGRASCASFANRKGENAEFVSNLKNNCTYFPVAPLQDLDVTTPHTFDNQYYANLLADKGVLNSDMELTRNEMTNQIVNHFAEDQGWFFATFSQAMQQMAHTVDESGEPFLGQIRANCSRVNTKEDTTLRLRGIAASA